ncbi:hypothetical protein SAMN06265348_11417 [Pedobacter westerhofensis]|uniref:Uncharacterized protein n=1 Tax=Pedobacter westerhofensis TaxID=425512 RepID=A0A521FM60_9SPHI|nr:hypothetical protein SAMN06265348_11417 [Pedobacter westerhofensis]
MLIINNTLKKVHIALISTYLSQGRNEDRFVAQKRKLKENQ